MAKTLRRLAALAALAVGAACGSAKLQSGKGQLATPASLDFGDVYVGATATKAMALHNTGTDSLALTLEMKGNAQLSVASPPVAVSAGATVEVPITLYAGSPGPFTGTLEITGDATAQGLITGTVVADPACPPGNACETSVFVPDAGECVMRPLPDGQVCDAGDPCQSQTTCAQGVCKGLAADCDDGDACTADYCQAGMGCQHLDKSASCDGTNPCQIYYCDPKAGCQSSSASDGTPCSAEVACVHATICFQGQCTGAPVLDGTPCVDPRDPCVTDATCSSGLCDSPTADALVPGDLLWQKVSSVYAFGDGGSVWDGGGLDNHLGWRAAAAVDDLGNLYLDDVQPGVDGAAAVGDFVSLDVCGNERWRIPYTSSQQWTNGRHLLTAGVVITVGQDQTLAGHSETTGALLWTFDPQQQAGLDPLSANGFTIEDVALSSSGVLYYSADWTYDDPQLGALYNTMLGGVLRNGQSKFQTTLAAEPFDLVLSFPRRFGYPLMVDENENLYTSIDLASESSQILSYDQTGNARFQIPVMRSGLNGLAENQGLFVEPVSLTAFNAQGSVLWAHTEPASVVAANGHSPVIDSNANITVLRDRLDLGEGVVECYAPGGTLLWQFTLNPTEVGTSSQVLDAQNLLYFATNTASGANQRLIALRAADGSQVWSKTLPTTAPVYNGVLAYTPEGSLIASVNERLFSVFAGNGLSTAPWPRFRSANTNASSAQPAGIVP